MKTIHHYAIQFFETENILDNHYFEGEQFYAGEIKNLSYKKASKIAQIHPNCLKYYELAMMPLFQGKGKLSKGTENPVGALESYKTKKEKDFKYVLIYRLFGGNSNKVSKKELSKELNKFYNKWITIPGAPLNSKRYICHDHTEELAKKFNIDLKFNE